MTCADLTDKDLNPYYDLQGWPCMYILILSHASLCSLLLKPSLASSHIPSFSCVVLFPCNCPHWPTWWRVNTFSLFRSHLNYHFKEVLEYIDQKEEKIYIFDVMYVIYITYMKYKWTWFLDSYLIHWVINHHCHYLFWCSIYLCLTNEIPFNLSVMPYWHVFIILWVLPCHNKIISSSSYTFPAPSSIQQY